MIIKYHCGVSFQKDLRYWLEGETPRFTQQRAITVSASGALRQSTISSLWKKAAPETPAPSSYKIEEFDDDDEDGKKQPFTPTAKVTKRKVHEPFVPLRKATRLVTRNKGMCQSTTAAAVETPGSADSGLGNSLLSKATLPVKEPTISEDFSDLEIPVVMKTITQSAVGGCEIKEYTDDSSDDSDATMYDEDWRETTKKEEEENHGQNVDLEMTLKFCEDSQGNTIFDGFTQRRPQQSEDSTSQQTLVAEDDEYLLFKTGLRSGQGVVQSTQRQENNGGEEFSRENSRGNVDMYSSFKAGLSGKTTIQSTQKRFGVRDGPATCSSVDDDSENYRRFKNGLAGKALQQSTQKHDERVCVTDDGLI